MPFLIIQQDITKIKTDAIVNAANTALRMGGGVCGAIFRAAGATELQASCDKLAPIQTGDAVLTPGFKLPAKYIIHTAGPIYYDGKHGEAIQLRSCYSNSLKLALENRCKSIAFPLISSGIYGYPKKEALSVATSAFRDFLAENEMEIYLAVLDKSSIVVDENLLKNLSEYIDRVYEKPGGISTGVESDSVKRIAEPFLEMLIQMVKKSGLPEMEVCSKANLSREWFSKIRSESRFYVIKQTIIALSIALKISFEEMADLLAQTGFGLSGDQLFDVIVSYFMRNKLYDIDLINEVLFLYDQPLLGSWQKYSNISFDK